ncbi:MAG: hypothetical protein LBB76_04435 [Azoarcus sp.]|jgi:hypothetical protein|nr:hypothetical protein [Azoarcus sp.]
MLRIGMLECRITPSAYPTYKTNVTLTLGDLLVICGERVRKDLLYKRFCKQFGGDSVWWLNKQEQRKAPPKGYGRDYLCLANLESATGLEAGMVFLVGMEHLFSDDRIPGLDETARGVMAEEKARKLYMAMTRAGQGLVLLSSQPVPAFIGEERISQSVHDASVL